MWLKWLPWRFVVRRLARVQGFLDPIALVSSLQRFSQPSEVLVPTELLRAGAVLQARGLMNSQAIQHNLDWIWPYWVERQFDPTDIAFIPRAFNLTHINLTHRNWTAIGVPSFADFPIVDPRGLVTPFFDGWSIDGWIFSRERPLLVPSREEWARQRLFLKDRLAVETTLQNGSSALESVAEVLREAGDPVCRLRFKARSASPAWLVLALRPYNPEGVSFIHQISAEKNGWTVNKHEFIRFDKIPSRYAFSHYKKGDVASSLFEENGETKVRCEVGMASAAALFEIGGGASEEVSVRVPLVRPHVPRKSKLVQIPSEERWEESLKGCARLQIPDAQYQFLYEAALKTLILHAPQDTVYPGPYTYKRFWFRDAAFIVHAMLCAGFVSRAEKIIDRFPSRQTPFGYFLSQDGEWDSNGEALWIMKRFGELTGRVPKAAWKNSAFRAARWIERKRLSATKASADRPAGILVAGLFPAGFSAEHLGPSDFYYWDNFWGLAGLHAAAEMAEKSGESAEAGKFRQSARDFSESIEKSLEQAAKALGSQAIPASPHRRLDAGAIGSLVASYPLKLWGPKDARILETMRFLLEHSFVSGGFFQEISHSGINPYLTLHVAQALLRAGDPRALDLMERVSALASPTGQWPEAIHPKTLGGCMGDGQHVWAVAEWVLMLRNFFVREEESEKKLILFSGIPARLRDKGEMIAFGPAPTSYGSVSLRLQRRGDKLCAEWDARWHSEEPAIEVRLPGLRPVEVGPGQTRVEITP